MNDGKAYTLECGCGYNAAGVQCTVGLNCLAGDHSVEDTGQRPKYKVVGHDPTPDGYRDHLLYAGDSPWQAIKAWRAGRREGMVVALIMPKPLDGD